MWSVCEGDITLARAGDGEAGDRADDAVGCACSRLAGRSQTVSGIFSDAVREAAVNRFIILGAVVEVLTCAQHWFGSPS